MLLATDVLISSFQLRSRAPCLPLEEKEMAAIIHHRGAQHLLLLLLLLSINSQLDKKGPNPPRPRIMNNTGPYVSNVFGGGIDVVCELSPPIPGRNPTIFFLSSPLNPLITTLASIFFITQLSKTETAAVVGRGWRRRRFFSFESKWI